MEAIQSRVESWIKDQRSKIMNVSWGPLRWRLRWWPPWSSSEHREHRKRIHLEYERRRKQLHDLCLALQADSIPDLQDILCCMVLSECVYKRPAAELVRTVNKFKADFGGHVVSIERVQPSADHVPHRYLLAEAGDTLFASFVGTKQYKDVMADANILQGAIFHDDLADTDENEATDSDYVDNQRQSVQNPSKSLEKKIKQSREGPKPAAHRGFLARAKGIPALELYRLAQKKKRKLVLCGHSLGGAVAALATLAILRVISASAASKDDEKLPVKCITFSQPPVGNAALRDYVHGKGWHQYFKSYCIPEDLVPRILSPAYFHHYNAQIPSVPMGTEISLSNNPVVKGDTTMEKRKDTEGEQLVLGLGPVQNSFWRLSQLVPLEGVRRHINKYRGKNVGSIGKSGRRFTTVEDESIEPQSLEIQEGSDSISLKPISDDKASDITLVKSSEKGQKDGDGRRWPNVPYLPSYVPFGQLYLLGNSAVELLSGAEYSKLTSVKSVIAELRERLQSHSMKSYRARFQRIYEICVGDGPSIFPGLDQLQQFPNLQHWLGRAVVGTVELGHIVEDPIIGSATSVVPLGWNGNVEKNGEPFKVEIAGFGLHLCTLVHAQVNGTWCSTTVESFPSPPSHSSNHGEQHELQKMRVLVGPPLKRPPYHQIVEDSLLPAFSTINKEAVNASNVKKSNPPNEVQFMRPDDPIDLYIFCTSDFTTVSREVHLRTRRVRLLGLEGAGKTSLFKALTGQGKLPVIANIESLLPDSDVQEGIAGGICYSDSFGVNLQELSNEVSRFKDELWTGIRDLSRKTDLIVLVHNLSHKIPQYNSPDGSERKPALSLLLDEAKALGIPWVLAITNKFSVSGHQQKAAIEAVLQGYHASPSSTEVVNSCPYVIPGVATASLSWAPGSSEQKGPNKLIFAPINIVRMPFQRKDTVFPVEGVNSLRHLVHRVLRSQEEASLEELARDSLMTELARDRARAMGSGKDSQAKSSISAATVGASVGAGLGLVLAVVMGAASALRKP